MKNLKCFLMTAATLLTFTGSAAQTVLENDFSDVAQFERYTVIDHNQDGQTWRYDDYFMAAGCARDYDADDWLVSPGVKLLAAKTYKLTVAAFVEQSDTEVFAIVMGQEPTAGALSPMLSAIETMSVMPEEHSVIFTVPADGIYYFGVHYMTTDNFLSNKLYVDRVLLEETMNQHVPAAATDLTVTPDRQGALKATVSFTAPTLTVGGDPLTQLTAIGLYRDTKLVHTFESPAVGAQLSFDDNLAKSGSVTYRVVATNEVGSGASVETTAYVGEDVPGPVENLRFDYDYATHEVKLSWDLPATGAHGGWVNTEGLTYEVRRFHASDPMATGIVATTFEDEVDIDFLLQAEEEMRQKYADVGMPVTVNYVIDGQGLMQYYVRAVSSIGRGSEAKSNSIVIGDEYTLPFVESFADGQLTHYWRTDIRTRLARWTTIADSRFTQDGDGGMLAFTATEGDETGMCHTGNISMKDALTPVLTFYYFYGEAMANPLLVKVSKDGGDFETLATIDMSDESKKARYLRTSVPLTGCAGHDYVQVAFETTLATAADVLYIDNVLIFDQRTHDLSVAVTSLPRNLKVGETRYLTASVMNHGTEDVATGQYSVDVYVDGQKAGSTTGMTVKTGEQQNALVALQASINMKAMSDIYAEVVYTADEAPYNNRSDVQTISVKLPRYPGVTALRAEADGEGALLSWNTPAEPRTDDGYVTESFEDYDDFQRTNFGDWTLYDGDRMLTYGIGGWHFPKNSDIQSWMIWTPSLVENTTNGTVGMTNPLWYPRTGDKMVVSFSAYQNESDDWLISPELSGHAQVISFYAHSLPTYADRFQLYFSTSGCETTNFMALDAQPRVVPDFNNQTFMPEMWEDCRFEYALPQGTKYFAIRKVTDDGWVMFVDDITFAPDTLAAQNGLMLFGYYIYKNGTRVNTALVTSPTFADPSAQPGDVYKVTAVYNEGESVYSNEVVFGQTEGIGTPLTNRDQRTDDSQTYDLQGRAATQSVKGVIIRNGKKILR